MNRNLYADFYDSNSRRSTSLASVNYPPHHLSWQKSRSVSPVNRDGMSLTAPSLPTISTPSSSRRWKLQVMESLHISSPSMALIDGEHSPSPLPRSASKHIPNRPSNVGKGIKCNKSRRPQGLTTLNDSASAIKHERGLGDTKSPTSSLHLYNMHISRRLRATSSFSSAYPKQNNSRSSNMPRRRFSSSGFGSEEVPPSWGQVLSNPEPADPCGSSVYSSQPGSPALSQIDVRSIDGEIQASNKVIALTMPDFGFGTSPSPPLTPRRAHNLPTNPSTSSLGKESRFKEELDISAPSGKRQSMLSFLTRGAKKSTENAGSATIAVEPPEDDKEQHAAAPKVATNRRERSRSLQVDEEQKSGKTIQQTAIHAIEEQVVLHTATRIVPSVPPWLLSEESLSQLSTRRNAVGMFAKAIRATELERAAFLLPEHKHLSRQALKRPRSASYCPPTATNTSPEVDTDKPNRVLRSHSDSCMHEPQVEDSGARKHSHYLQVPGACEEQLAAIEPLPSPGYVQQSVSFSTPFASLSREDALYSTSLPYISRCDIIDELDDNDETLGAWSRYPSHTRASRTGSAGAKDKVHAKDFGYVPNPLWIHEVVSSDEIFPRSKSIHKQKWSPKKIPVVEKGREIFRNYSNFFRSPSLDYLRHGYGRRSSIDPGGAHPEPELEILPDLWTPLPMTSEERAEKSRLETQGSDRSDKGKARAVPQPSPTPPPRPLPPLPPSPLDEHSSVARYLGKRSLDGTDELESWPLLPNYLCPSASNPELRLPATKQPEHQFKQRDVWKPSEALVRGRSLKQRVQPIKKLSIKIMKPPTRGHILESTHLLTPQSPAFSSTYSDYDSPGLAVQMLPVATDA